MPQLLFLLVVLGAGYFTYRKFVSDAQKLAARRKMEERERETGSDGTLIEDPVTGEYRLRRHGDQD